MDGLECEELLFSTVKNANKSTRFDPEYYSKLALSTESFILSKPHYFLDTRNVVSGPFGSTLKSSSYLEKGDVPFVRIENIKGGFYISRSNLVYISSFDNSRIANSQLSEDDIVLSKVGNSIGFFARVDSVLKGCNISENNIGIKLEGFSTAQKHAILTYFNSKYGQILLLRRRSGNAQPKLNVDDVCFIPICCRKYYGVTSGALHRCNRCSAAFSLRPSLCVVQGKFARQGFRLSGHERS